MTRRAGAPARGAPWWIDMDPPGVGGNPVSVPHKAQHIFQSIFILLLISATLFTVQAFFVNKNGG
jgi:hypothetical protein